MKTVTTHSLPTPADTNPQRARIDELQKQGYRQRYAASIAADEANKAKGQNKDAPYGASGRLGRTVAGGR